MNGTSAWAELTPGRTELTPGWAARRPVAITWSPEPELGDREPAGSLRPAISGDLLVADLRTVDPGLLEIADVICCPAGQSADLRPVLERYPWCAVVVAECGPQEFRVGTRGSQVITVKTRVDCGGWAACFVYCWMAAGGAADVLESARLVVSPLAVPAHRAEAGHRDPGPPYGSIAYIFRDLSVTWPAHPAGRERSR